MSNHDQRREENVLTRGRNIIPPWAKERVVSPGNFLSENVDAFVVEGREAAEEGVEYTPKGPHIDALAVSFVLDNFWGGVANGSTWCHCLLLPNDFAEAEIRDLHSPNAAATNARNELSLVFLVLVVRSPNGIFRGDDLYSAKQKILGLDVSVNDASFLVQVANALSDLKDNMSRQVLTKVCELDDLMKKLSTLHNWGLSEASINESRKRLTFETEEVVFWRLGK